MPRRVALELFSAAPRGDGDVGPEGAAMPAEAGAALETEAMPEPAPLPDPEAEAEAERRESLARIAVALESIAADQSALTARRLADAAAALGGAAESVLPRLARAGFAALVAESAERVARDGCWPGLELRASCDEAAEIAEFLARQPPGPIEVKPDATLAAGEVLLAWSDGGAEIRVEEIVAEALERVRRALSSDAEDGA